MIIQEDPNPFNGVTVEKFTISLEARSVMEGTSKCETRYRWKRSDGAFVSPECSTIQCAKLFSERMPMMSDAEWIECNPGLKIPK